MQAEGAPIRITLLPSLRLQERDLCHVREKDAGHEELPTKLNLITDFCMGNSSRMSNLYKDT